METQKLNFLDLFISTDALHVSGGSSAHHRCLGHFLTIYFKQVAIFGVSKQTELYLFPNYSPKDATFLDLFISTDALHVSGGSSAHHRC